MQDFWLEVGRWLVSQGPLGVLSLAACGWGWLERGRAERLSVQLAACQEARVALTQAVTSAIQQNTTTGATLLSSRESQTAVLEQLVRANTTMLLENKSEHTRTRDRLEQMHESTKDLARACGGRGQ